MPEITASDLKPDSLFSGECIDSNRMCEHCVPHVDDEAGNLKTRAFCSILSNAADFMITGVSFENAAKEAFQEAKRLGKIPTRCPKHIQMDIESSLLDVAISDWAA